MKKLLIASTSAVATFLLVAAVFSLVTGRSILPATGSSSLDGAKLYFDEERMATAASLPGSYRLHIDPRIGFVLQADSSVEFAKTPATTDDLGQRARVGPAPQEDSFRIALVGDSVAFGYGVRDDECLAHQLETRLNEVHGGGGSAFVCDTVAVPGWNTRNSVRFLQAHFDRYEPDLVLYLPIENDLADTEGVWESGHRRTAPDAASPDPFLTINTSRTQLLMSGVALRLGERASSGYKLLGPHALRSDLGGESSRRFDDCARLIADLDRWLEARGVPLLLLQYREEHFHLHLQRRVQRERPDLVVLPLVIKNRREDTLGHDAHANATTLSQYAIWIAGDLLERGLVPGGEGNPLAEVRPDWADRRAATPTLARVERLSDEKRAADNALLKPRIEFESAGGLLQVYGGLSPAGEVGPRFLAALAAGGRFVEVELAPLEAEAHLYPLSVRVQVDGADVGSLELRADDTTRLGRFAVPTASQVQGVAIEVRLIPESWGILESRGGRFLASCELVRLACVD